MKRAIERAEKQIPPEPHWGFCYSMLHKVSRSFSLVIQQLRPELRNAVCFLLSHSLDRLHVCVSVYVYVAWSVNAFIVHVFDHLFIQ